MKKNYVKVEVDVIFLAPQDIITASVNRIVYDPDGILNDPMKLDAWEW